MVYVNFNYRVNGFGWLAGKEALAGGAANVGLYDREHHSDQRHFTTSDSGCDLTLFCILILPGSYRKVLPALDQGLHFQIRW